jgi:hypothetical protein
VISEQRVRTEAGWIGVEISRSRVRTPGKVGYGLYRVRPKPRSTDLPEDLDEMWTGYLFTLDEIYLAVQNSIQGGTPTQPALLYLSHELDSAHREFWNVPTRWTSAYRGPRDLGVSVPVAVKPEHADQLNALAVLVDAGLIEMRHVEGCLCVGTQRLEAACVRLTLPERERRRQDNAAFAAEQAPRRAAGLRARHARKLSRPVRRGTTGIGEDGPPT